MSGVPLDQEIVGRVEELDAIDGFLAASERRFGALLVRGPAGIGRTVLWRAATASARSRGHRVLASTPTASESVLTFAGLVDLFTELAEEAAGILPVPQRRALRAALLLEDADASTHAVAAGCLTLLRHASHDQPVLLAVDDAQWLDPATVTVLSYVVRRLRAERVGLIVAYRDDGHAGDPLALLDGGRSRPVTELELAPLSMGALHRLLGLRLGRSFPRPVVRRLHELSRGNAFVALELARSLPEHAGRKSLAEPLPVPARVRDLILDRIALEIRPPEQACLRLLAVAGDLTVQQLTDAGVPASGLTAMLDNLVHSGLVEILDGHVRFAHPLYGSTVYGDIPPFRRRELHRTLARVATDPERRARHLALATDAPEAPVADALERASRLALRRGAPASAADLAESAARLTPPAGEEQRRERLVLASEGHMAAGDPKRARALLADLARDLPPGPVRARVLCHLADVSGDDVAAQTACCEQALREAGGDPELEAMLHLQLATLSWLGADYRAAARHARAAVARAQQNGDRRTLAIALAEVAHAEANLTGRVPDEEMQQAIRLEANVADFPPFLRPTYRHGALLARLGELDRGRSLMAAELARARDRGADGALPGILCYLVDLERRAGRWDVAAGHLAEAIALARQASIPQEQQAVQVRVAMEAALVGDVDRCRRAAAGVLEIAGTAGWRLLELQARGALGLLELSLGDPMAAHDHLAPATALLTAMEVTEVSQYAVIENDLEALVALACHAAAARLTDDLHARGQHADLPRLLALAARGRALLEAAHGDLEAARAQVQVALSHHTRFVEPFEHARTLLVAGGIERRARQKRRAREPLDRALAIFERLGARQWIDRTRDELDRIGGRPPATGGLTPAERRVADLVATGRSNAEVAAALHVTRKTVEKHLSHVYAKLGVGSRVELARRQDDLLRRE